MSSSAEVMKMKILVFAPFFPPDPTGSSIFAGQQARELLRLGHEVFVVTNGIDKNAPVIDETADMEGGFAPHEVHRLRSLRINLGKITWNYGIPVSIFGFFQQSFKRKVREFDPDLVIVHSTLFDLSLLALVWAKKNKKNTIIVSHTALWHDIQMVNMVMRLYGRLVLRRLVKRARAKIVCVDKWTFDNAMGLFGDELSLSTIPVSVELGLMNGGDAEKIRNRHGLGNGPAILSLGHVVPLRNRLNLTRAIPLLVKDFPDLKILVVGMVKDSRFLELASQLGVLDHIVLAGPVPHSEIKDYLAAADVEIHDLDGRGLGITSVEAMDAGVPIVAWAVDNNYPQFSLRSYGDSGFIDDGKPETIAKAITRLTTDDAYRASVVQSQRRLVDDIYSVESVTRQYLNLSHTLDS
jgi:1,2-diacylglycerol 3-alpha-glucosyltransferase